ncbi:hypothetical protein PG623_03165 [Riemerella anatipestifer]|nr:hypothetical protein [Riemerella anatipestifer]
MEILKQALSWIHIISATLSLIFGTIVIISKKGNTKHLKIGICYFYAMLINNITALLIINSRGEWFFPHYLAIACLIVLIPGILSIKFKPKFWLKIHIVSMVLSYYLLIGGAINETFLHIPKLQKYIYTNDPIVGITHFICQLFFIIVLIYFLIKYRNFLKKKNYE